MANRVSLLEMKDRNYIELCKFVVGLTSRYHSLSSCQNGEVEGWRDGSR